MSKRNRNRGASSTPQASNELDAMLAGIESTVPEGVLAGSALESLEDEERHDEITITGPEIDDGDLLSLHGGDEQEPGGLEPTIQVVNPDLAETGVDKQAIYDGQTSTLTPASEEDAARVEQPKKGRKKSTAVSGTTAGPKITVTGGPKSGVLSSKADLQELVKLGVNETDIPGLVAKIDELPKKVSEKAYNLMRYACGREVLSNYTRFSIEALRDHGPLTVPELVAKMQARGWSTGTARSQSQQMSRLFTVYDMVTKADGKIGLNTTNPFVKNVVDRLAAKAA